MTLLWSISLRLSSDSVTLWSLFNFWRLLFAASLSHSRAVSRLRRKAFSTAQASKTRKFFRRRMGTIIFVFFRVRRPRVSTNGRQRDRAGKCRALEFARITPCLIANDWLVLGIDNDMERLQPRAWQRDSYKGENVCGVVSHNAERLHVMQTHFIPCSNQFIGCAFIRNYHMFRFSFSNGNIVNVRRNFF